MQLVIVVILSGRAMGKLVGSVVWPGKNSLERRGGQSFHLECCCAAGCALEKDGPRSFPRFNHQFVSDSENNRGQTPVPGVTYQEEMWTRAQHTTNRKREGEARNQNRTAGAGPLPQPSSRQTWAETSSEDLELPSAPKGVYGQTS